MTAIINEASGERAMHHVLELVPLSARAAARRNTRATSARARSWRGFAKEYGFSNVTIEKLRPPGQAWQPTQGELWMTTPKIVKLFDIHDIALSLASLNSNGDITGELVDVGAGRAQDFEGKDVTGKFVLAVRAAPGGVYAQAVQRGAHRRDRRSARSAISATFDFPNQIVSTHGERAAGHRRVGGVARTCSANCGAAAARPEDHDSLDRRRACRCRPDSEIRARRDSRRRQHDAGSRRSAATSTKASSSRAPTTTTPAAR